MNDAYIFLLYIIIQKAGLFVKISSFLTTIIYILLTFCCFIGFCSQNPTLVFLDKIVLSRATFREKRYHLFAAFGHHLKATAFATIRFYLTYFVHFT